MPVETRLKQLRTGRGISAAELARQTGVTRQTIYGIEDGTFVPNTAVALQLARALDVSVEDIFSLEAEQATALVEARVLGDEPVRSGQLLRLCRVGEGVTAVPVSLIPAFLPVADGVVQSEEARSGFVNAGGGAAGENSLLIAGCDPALSLLTEALRGSGIDVVAVSASSRRALNWLKQGKVHAAGSHLFDKASGEYNVPFVRKLLPSAAFRVVTFAAWEQGLVVVGGNPKSIHSVADLARRGVRFRNREKGSGSRDLLDGELRRLGLEPGRVPGYDDVAPGHLAAAHSVMSGAADCCIAPRSAASCFGLDFVPLTVQRFDLTFSEAALELAGTKALFEILNRSGFQRRLREFAGYDSARTGQVLV